MTLVTTRDTEPRCGVLHQGGPCIAWLIDVYQLPYQLQAVTAPAVKLTFMTRADRRLSAASSCSTTLGDLSGVPLVRQLAAHAHRLLAPDEEGYFWRHQLPQYVSAVTAACLVVRRDRFMAVGGFNTESFAVAFNDVDLCLRLNRKGWQSFYEPRARLVHHESVSRGFDRDRMSAQRFAGELRALRRNWMTDAIVDPFHHPSLSQYSERFVVNL